MINLRKGNHFSFIACLKTRFFYAFKHAINDFLFLFAILRSLLIS